eukprot:CAMPEP_0204360534 /NCGR_PEP_ID=MMETSP0469-20131031/38119_1 /ASSEMBLY_ACC=CAM_ASM_000384 /TAXON_ID=2969 /ORGANISM="Oxyrrhis marina" /LENGTH=75 /DNA_ID=CAMNT_0051348775 /DNA_START=653 /DNA_END=876 /DNA_ORIENTATION=+
MQIAHCTQQLLGNGLHLRRPKRSLHLPQQTTHVMLTILEDQKDTLEAAADHHVQEFHDVGVAQGEQQPNLTAGRP